MEVCLMGTFTLSDIVAEKYSFNDRRMHQM